MRAYVYEYVSPSIISLLLSSQKQISYQLYVSHSRCALSCSFIITGCPLMYNAAVKLIEMKEKVINNELRQPTE